MIVATSFSLYLRSSDIIHKNRTIQERSTTKLDKFKYEELFVVIIIHTTIEYDSKVSW